MLVAFLFLIPLTWERKHDLLVTITQISVAGMLWAFGDDYAKRKHT